MAVFRRFMHLAVVAAGTSLVACLMAESAVAQAGVLRDGSAAVAKMAKVYKVKVHAGKPKRSSGASAGSDGGGCLPPIIGSNRESLCLVFPAMVTVVQLENGDPVGDEVYKFGVQTIVDLSATSARFAESVAVVGLTTTGDDPGLDPTITVTSQCDQPCRDTSPQLLAVGTPQVAAGKNSNGVDAPSNQVVWPSPVISLFAGYGGYESNTVSWPVMPAIRCDHMYPGLWKAGCVFPGYAPTVDMSGLPHITRGISRVQGRGGHVGRPGGGHPLHRASSAVATKHNRRLVCPKHLPRPKGSSCDEYPFASTVEGGMSLPPIDRIIQWVPLRENQNQGVILSAFYRHNRVLRGDAFYVFAGK